MRNIYSAGVVLQFTLVSFFPSTFNFFSAGSVSSSDSAVGLSDNDQIFNILSQDTEQN